ncbi:MAG TPA: hypothetical protein VMU54_04205 [Planctomycetota bacterium]|nr:hypothetical protein [Planctomycetota bacterium]
MIHISGLALAGLVVAGSLFLMLLLRTLRGDSGLGPPRELPMDYRSKEDLR